MGQVQRGGADGEDDEGLGAEVVPGLVLGGMEDLGVEDELVYDLDEWSERDLDLLRDRLERLAVPHRWEGASLVIASGDEAWLERILDQVDDDLSLAVDPDVPQVAYDLSGWGADHRETLLEALVDEAVPHGWDGEELFVHEIDEERVDELVDEVLGRGPDDDGPVGGRPDGQEAMGDLFVAADKLRAVPRGPATRQAFIAAAERAGAAAAPYGIERAWWDGTVRAAEEVVALIEAGDGPVDPPEADEHPVAVAADALRQRLRPLV
jgi:hypothetical protein